MKSAFVVCAFAFTTALDRAAILATTPVAARAATTAVERAERAAVSEAAARAVVSACTAHVGLASSLGLALVGAAGPMFRGQASPFGAAVFAARELTI